MSPEVSGLLELLEKMATVPLVDICALGEDIVGLKNSIARAQAELLRRLQAFDVSGRARDEGYRSTTSWVQDKTSTTPQAAARERYLARVLDSTLPQVGMLFASGAISFDHVRVAADTVRGLSEAAVEAADRILAESSVEMDANDPRAVGGGTAICTAADRERGRKDEQRQRDDRRLHLSPMLDGMWSLTGRLTADVAEACRAVLDACATADPADLPARTPGQRRADAFADGLRRLLDVGKLPETGGERPHLVLTCQVAALSDPESGVACDSDEPPPAGAWPFAALPTPLRICSLDRTGTVSPDLARLIACDASVTRVLLTGKSEVLDVGRRTRVVSAALRRAIVVRDGCCRWPGCDIPQSWSQVHHVRHWAHGGTTDRANCLLLCPAHHSACHDGQWIITLLAPGRIRVRRREHAAQPLYEIRTPQDHTVDAGNEPPPAAAPEPDQEALPPLVSAR
jgi:hypothetical protein